MASEHEIQIHVGASVRFRYGFEDVAGRVKEDRGPIGKGGRRLYLIAFQAEPGDVSEIELPAEPLQVQHHSLLS